MKAVPVTSPRDARARVPEGTVVYAVGDVHGCRDALESLLAAVEADAARRLAPRRVVVFLGDYVDRGPHSKAVVERLMAGPPASGPLAGAQWVCLKGNHEETMVRFLSEPGLGPRWFLNGGLDTIRSYAGDLGDEDDLFALQLALSRALPPSHLRFLARLPVTHAEGDYLFVHAGVRPGVALDDQEPADLLWIRDEFLSAATDFGKVVVHGHTIAPLPELRPNRIGVDTGAYRTGRLTAVVLEGADKSFLTS